MELKKKIRQSRLYLLSRCRIRLKNISSETWRVNLITSKKYRSCFNVFVCKLRGCVSVKVLWPLTTTAFLTLPSKSIFNIDWKLTLASHLVAVHRYMHMAFIYYSVLQTATVSWIIPQTSFCSIFAVYLLGELSFNYFKIYSVLMLNLLFAGKKFEV